MPASSGLVVEPDEIAAFDLARRRDFTGNRKAEALQMRGIGFGLAAARGLSHMRQYQALRRHDQRVMRIEAVEGQSIAGRQGDDFGAGAAQARQARFHIHAALRRNRASNEN